MGAVGCEIHDTTAGIIVCPHIKDFVISRTSNDSKDKTTKVGIEVVTIKQPYNTRIAYCSTCKKRHFLPTIYFRICYDFYFFFPFDKPKFKMKAYRICIECFYKELFNFELKRFSPEKGVIEFTPAFTGRNLRILSNNNENETN